MRVLFVNQTGVMSGAEHSLLELLAVLPTATVAGLACPPGELAVAARQAGITVWYLRGTDLSYRLHLTQTPRGLARLLLDGARLRAIAELAEADIIHANSARAGLLASLAARSRRLPLVVHLRDWVPEGPLPSLAMRTLQAAAAAIITNSAAVRAQLPAERAGPVVRVIHNPVDPERFEPERLSGSDARRALGLGAADPVLAMVGQLTPWKGQDDAIRIAAILRRRYPQLALLVVGSARFATPGTRYDIESYVRRLDTLVSDLELESVVRFLGQRADIATVMRAADVVLVPSWHEAFGRVAAEALACGTPAVVTAVGGPSEIVRDGIDGLVLPPRQPELWAARLEPLLADAAHRAALGHSGRRRAVEAFSPQAHMNEVLEVYRAVLSGQAGASAPA